MQKQFDQYSSNIDPMTADLRDNPFDFGYRYPNRVKVQFISESRCPEVAGLLRCKFGIKTIKRATTGMWLRIDIIKRIKSFTPRHSRQNAVCL